MPGNDCFESVVCREKSEHGLSRSFPCDNAEIILFKPEGVQCYSCETSIADIAVTISTHWNTNFVHTDTKSVIIPVSNNCAENLLCAVVF